jgi:protein phosphatase
MVTDDRLREVITGEHDLDRAADRMIELANAHGGIDNITVVLARIEPA